MRSRSSPAPCGRPTPSRGRRQDRHARPSGRPQGRPDFYPPKASPASEAPGGWPPSASRLPGPQAAPTPTSRACGTWAWRGGREAAQGPQVGAHVDQDNVCSHLAGRMLQCPPRRGRVRDPVRPAPGLRPEPGPGRDRSVRHHRQLRDQRRGHHPGGLGGRPGLGARQGRAPQHPVGPERHPPGGPGGPIQPGARPRRGNLGPGLPQEGARQGPGGEALLPGRSRPRGVSPSRRGAETPRSSPGT